MKQQWQQTIDNALNTHLTESIARKYINPKYICSLELNLDTDTIWVYVTNGQCIQIKFQEDTPQSVIVSVLKAYEALMLNS